MPKSLDPELYGLPKRTVLEKKGQTVYIVIDRKSRIIMADGKKIMQKVEAIRSFEPAARVGLKTSAPLCSKTKSFLEEADVTVLCSFSGQAHPVKKEGD